MGRASAGKSKPKQSFAKGVSSVVATAKSVREDMHNFRKEWADKFNGLQQKMDRIVPAIATQFAQLQMNNQIVSNCVDSIDLQQQAMMKILANLYAKNALLVAAVEDQASVLMDDMGLDMESLKTAGMDDYITIAQESVRLAQEERAAAIKAQEASQKAAAEEAHQAAAAKSEADRAESALQTAHEDDKLVVGEPGGPGVSIPAGAEVFGG